jgi:diaminopimelate epimerase
MVIYNADGGLVPACGNATRCIALMMLREIGGTQCVIETESGNRYARYDNDKIVVNMGMPFFNWRDIPTSQPVDTSAVLIHGNNAMLVNVGNPHCVFVVDDLADAPIKELGAKIENDPLFPQRINVEWIQIINRHIIKMRVWERGVGETDACGTGACAVVACSNKMGLVDSNVEVEMPGGVLSITIADDGNIWMSGDVAVSFTGVFQV